MYILIILILNKIKIFYFILNVLLKYWTFY